MEKGVILTTKEYDNQKTNKGGFMLPTVKEKNIINIDFIFFLSIFVISATSFAISVILWKDNPSYWLYVVLSTVMLVCSFALFMAGTEKDRCHYCSNKIYYFQRRIVAEWPELTENSRTEVVVGKYMHHRCHAAAADKLKIPNPKFSSFEI